MASQFQLHCTPPMAPRPIAYRLPSTTGNVSIRECRCCVDNPLFSRSPQAVGALAGKHESSYLFEGVISSNIYILINQVDAALSTLGWSSLNRRTMYFSAVPLLLLFASAISASPLSIEHRELVTSHPSSPPSAEQDNPVYQQWTQLSRQGRRFKYVSPNLYEMGDLRRIIVPMDNYEPTLKKIYLLKGDHKILEWGWDNAEFSNNIFFVVKMAKGARW